MQVRYWSSSNRFADHGCGNQSVAKIKVLRVTSRTSVPCYPLFASEPFLNLLRSVPEYVALLDRLKRQQEQIRSLIATAAH